MKPLYILPGLLEDAEAFAPQIAALRDSARVAVADMTRAYTIAGLAAAALQQAPAERFHLAGHSMGGYVALEMLRQAPQRIDSVALLNTHARPDTPEGTANRRRLMQLADTDFPAVIATLTPKLVTAEHLKDAALTGTIAAMALAVGAEAFKRQEQAIIERIDSRPHLAAIACPALVVAGRDDQLMPVEILRELADGIPGARLEVLEDCGHMASLEQPARVTALLRDWLA